MVSELKTLEERIRVIEDKDAVRKVTVKYVHAVDSNNLKELMNTFAQECSADYGPFGNNKTRAEVTNFFKEIPKRMPFMLHMLINEDIKITGETQAVGDWYFLVPTTHVPTNRALWVAGKYRNQYVKENGEWKISDMTCTFDFITGYDLGWLKEKMAKLH